MSTMQIQRVNKTKSQKEHTNAAWHDSDGAKHRPYQINALENYEMDRDSRE